MPVVNVHEAKTQLSRLLAQVEAGEEVVIARRGQPVARLVRCNPGGKRRFGAMKGKIKILLRAVAGRGTEALGGWIEPCESCSTRTRSCGGWPAVRDTAEVEAFDRLKRQLAAYRVVFGQPRQEERVTLLDRAGVDVARLRDWAVDLSPPEPQRTREEM